MTKAARQLARSVLSLCLVFMMVLGTVSVPVSAGEAERET